MEKSIFYQKTIRIIARSSNLKYIAKLYRSIFIGVSGYYFQRNIVRYSCLKIFTISNSIDPDEVQMYAVFQISSGSSTR